MRAERRSCAGAPPDLLARHAAEINRLNMQVASLKVEAIQSSSARTLLVVHAGLHCTASVVCCTPC